MVGPAESLTLRLTAGHPAVELDGVLTRRTGAEGGSGGLAASRRRRLVRIDGSRAAARRRVELSPVDLPVLPQELVELLPDDLRRRLDASAQS
ncbi:NAD+ kinase [Geodermatophilus africanus]|uniref:NAD+ kinase n=1 Tax=Geodermatophilus africanus TaxID=1137993 RepID=A0A1H3N339_9ACTN|nr:hypothetical protein [Geodermatophilus africanus]SDY83292.1 NAD+ kinase [Geodermatophilus africanus]